MSQTPSVTSGSGGAGPNDPARRQLIEMPVEMPVVQIFAAGFALPLLATVVSWILMGAARPQAGLDSAISAMIAVMVGTLLGPVLIQVWKPRPIPKWPMLLLAAQGISLFTVLALALLLYSATRPDPVMYLLVAGVSFIAVQFVQARLYAVGLKGHTTQSEPGSV